MKKHVIFIMVFMVCITGVIIAKSIDTQQPVPTENTAVAPIATAKYAMVIVSQYRGSSKKKIVLNFGDGKANPWDDNRIKGKDEEKIAVLYDDVQALNYMAERGYVYIDFACYEIKDQLFKQYILEKKN